MYLKTKYLRISFGISNHSYTTISERTTKIDALEYKILQAKEVGITLSTFSSAIEKGKKLHVELNLPKPDDTYIIW